MATKYPLLNRDQFIFATAHLHFFHVGELAKSLAGFNAFLKIAEVRFGELVDHIDGSLVHRQDIGGRMPRLRALTGAALTPAQSQPTDRLRNTLM